MTWRSTRRRSGRGSSCRRTWRSWSASSRRLRPGASVAWSSRCHLGMESRSCARSSSRLGNSDGTPKRAWLSRPTRPSLRRTSAGRPATSWPTHGIGRSSRRAACATTRRQPTGSACGQAALPSSSAGAARSADAGGGGLLGETANENCDVLNLPALSEGKGDALGRAEGKALWPERFPVEDLQRTRSLIGSMNFAALYQGRPVAIEGSIFRQEWFQRYREMPVRFERVVLSADTAFKEGQENDYSVVTVWGETQNAIYLLAVWRRRVGFPDLKRAIVSLAEFWKPQAVLIEDRASGLSLIQALKSETSLPVIPVKADTSKTSRAQAAAPMVEAGKVFLPESAPWLAEVLDGTLNFPVFSDGAQLDSTPMALAYLRGRPQPFDLEAYAAAEIRAPSGAADLAGRELLRELKEEAEEIERELKAAGLMDEWDEDE